MNNHKYTEGYAYATSYGSSYIDDLKAVYPSNDALKPIGFDVLSAAEGALEESKTSSYTSWYINTVRHDGDFTFEFNALETIANSMPKFSHVCVTKKQDSVVIYVDGVPVKGIYDRDGLPITCEEIEKEILLHETKESVAPVTSCHRL